MRPQSPPLSPALDAAAAQIFERFIADGVDAVLLKGASVARLLYEQPQERQYSDVDILVAPDALASARRILVGLGYRNASERLGIDDVGEVIHEENWISRAGGSQPAVLIEMHHRLAGASAPPEVVWRVLAGQTARLRMSGQDVPVLNRPALAMHLALHAAQHGADHAKGLRDLELAIERWPTELWRTAKELAEDIQAVEPMAAGLRLLPAGARLASELGLPATPRLDWEIKNRGARPRGAAHLEALIQAEGVPARLRVVRRSLMPSRRWIQWQYPWARPGGVRFVVAYAVHTVRAAGWAARALSFRWRVRRANRRAT